MNLDKETECPSKFLTNLLKSRQLENTIYLKNGTETTSDPKIISKLLSENMNNIHSARFLNPSLIKNFKEHIKKSNIQLNGEILESEVIEAIHKQRNGRSPGLDGIVAEFYKTFDKQLSPILTKMYNLILKEKKIPENFKTAIIRFIDKKKGESELPSGYRPISLLNLDYKILSSILSKRLQTVLPQLIDSNKAYIKNRNIIENILNLDSLFYLEHNYKYFLLSDFSSAFDSLNHEWINIVLENSNLGDSFCDWIKFLLQDMFAYPIIENKISPDIINLNAGVRQGDGLSGLLFNLALEPLVTALKKLKNAAFDFADDIGLATKDKDTLKETLKIFKSFEQVSNLKLNMKKTVISTIREKNNESYLCGLQLVNEFKYLGYKFTNFGIESTFLNEILENIICNLQKYKKSFKLSLIQKATVLNTYAFSKLYYFLQCSSPSINFFKKCDKIQRWFLSSTLDNFDPTKNYRTSMALHRLQNTKTEGGLNIVNIFAKFLAFRIRTFIKFRHEDNYFTNILLNDLRDNKFKISAIFTKKNANITPFTKYLFIALKYFTLSTSPEELQTCSIDDILNNQIPLYHENILVSELSTSEISKKIHKKLYLNKETPERIIELLKIFPNIDFTKCFKKIFKMKIRSTIKSFIFKIWNAILYLPDECNLCKSSYNTSSTIHFFECRKITNLFFFHYGKLLNIKDFFEKPNFKDTHTFIFLFSIYKIMIRAHFENENIDLNDPNIDFLIQTNAKEEILRYDNAFGTP